jgi:signal transduction histidine kinase/DNA-binding response OmpR family regulator
MSFELDFKALFDASPNPYMVLDTTLTIVAANDTYLRMTGRALDELTGMYVWDAFPRPPGEAGRQQAELEASLLRVLATAQPDVLAVLHYPIPDTTPKASDTDAPKADRAESRQGPEQAVGSGVQAFQDRYWSITHSPVLGPDGGLRFILQQAVDVTRMQQLKAAEHARHAKTPPRPVSPLAVSTLEQEEAGILQRARAIQQANRSLGEAHAQLRTMFEAAPGFMCFLRGPELVFELANRAFMNLIGQREVIGKPLPSALPELQEQGVVLALEAAYRSGIPSVGIDVSLRLRAPSELNEADAEDAGGAWQPAIAEVFVDYVIQPVAEANGSVSGIFVQGSNVTAKHLAMSALQRERSDLEGLVRESVRALRESEAERRHAEAALAHSQKMDAVGKLTGGVAHDFNNVLQIISGNLQLIGCDVGDDAQLQRRLDAAVEAVTRGARLASQLLTFARRQPLEPAVVDPAELWTSMDELLRRLLGETIEVETRIGTEIRHALVDANHFENVILNLVVNARDAMAGEGKLTVEIANAILDIPYANRNPGVVAGEYVMFALTDDGCGMPPDVLERVFEPFYTTKPLGQGTGLGLSMAYGFAKQSNGHIRIDSTVGQGTTVRLYLPRSDLPRAPRADAPMPAASGGDETILVVEDDDAVRRTVVDLLSQLGYHVKEATDGDAALAILESEEGACIDLLFSDVMMPGRLRGNVLLHAARAARPMLKVLFTSGYATEDIVHGGRLDAGLALIAKPYRQEELSLKLAAIFRRAPALSAAPSLSGSTAASSAAPSDSWPASSHAAPAPSATTTGAVVDNVEGAAMTATSRKGEASGDSAALARRRILLVEDDANTRASTAELLSVLGHDVVVAVDGETALDMLDQHEAFDILMTDLTLPGMSGLDLIEETRRRGWRMGVIVASGYRDTVLPGGDSRDAVMLPKPYDFPSLEAALRAAALARTGL